MQQKSKDYMNVPAYADTWAKPHQMFCEKYLQKRERSRRSMSVVKRLMVIGRIVEKLAPKICLVEVQRNELDPYLRMYFGRYHTYKADENAFSTKVGDYVLVKSKEKPQRIDLVLEVAEVVHRSGQLEDPVSRKRVVIDSHGVDFVGDMQYINQLLPDWKEQVGLRYTADDIPQGSSQHFRDKTGL